MFFHPCRHKHLSIEIRALRCHVHHLEPFLLREIEGRVDVTPQALRWVAVPRTNSLIGWARIIETKNRPWEFLTYFFGFWNLNIEDRCEREIWKLTKLIGFDFFIPILIVPK